MKKKYIVFIAVTIFVYSSVAGASTFIYSPDRQYRATKVLMSGGGREFNELRRY